MAISDPDGSGSLHAIIPHLIAPLQSGIQPSEIHLNNDGTFSINSEYRQPIILLELLKPTNNSTLIIQVEIDTAPPIFLTFPEWSEASAQLHLHSPKTDSLGNALPTHYKISLPSLPPTTPFSEHFKILSLQGNISKIAHLLSSEKARLRREALHLRAARQLNHATLFSLDQHGADLGVPRLKNRLQFSPSDTKPEITMTPYPDDREPDSLYRERLRLFRTQLKGTPAEINHLLNGPGKPNEPNRSALAQLGLKERFKIQETDNQFSVGIHLIADDEDKLKGFAQLLRTTHLILPAAIPENDKIHAERLESPRKQKQTSLTRETLRKLFEIPDPSFAIAPSVASALTSFAEILQILDLPTRPKLLRGFTSIPDNRFSLGLGVQLTKLPQSTLQKLHDALHSMDSPSLNEKGLALLSGIKPPPPSSDPLGRWLFHACGFQTVHEEQDDTIYISTLPTQGLRITGPSKTAIESPTQLKAQFPGTRETETNTHLTESLKIAAETAKAQGLESFKLIPDAHSLLPFRELVAPAELTSQQNTLDNFGISSFADDKSIERLKTLPAEHWSAIIFSSDFVEAPSKLEPFLPILKQNGIVSILPAVNHDKNLILIVANIALPSAGLNLAPRRSVGFRWNFLPIAFEKDWHHRLSPARQATITTIGSTSNFQMNIPGIYAIVVIGYTRGNHTDPYEFSLSLPPKSTLKLDAYEFLMNALERIHPAGIQVNTWDLRQQSIDLDNDQKPDRFPPSLARTYRSYKTRS